MINMYADIEIAVIKFPSPYGVSFILMQLVRFMLGVLEGTKVSVSLRSIIHSYG